jgi:hypothetical protein
MNLSLAQELSVIPQSAAHEAAAAVGAARLGEGASAMAILIRE